MKKVIISVLTMLFISLFSVSCREKKTSEKVEDALESVTDDVGDGIEKAADEVEDAVD